MDDKINLAQKLALLDDFYSPGIVGYLNDYKLAVVKVHGEFVWHAHEDMDDFFLVVRGHLTIQLRGRDGDLRPVAQRASRCALRSFSARFKEEVGVSPSRYRDRAVRRGGAPPIPGCFVLMWTQPRAQSGRSHSDARSLSSIESERKGEVT